MFGNREQVEIGDYTLIPHERWMLWSAVRNDGRELHPRLSGMFSDVEAFRKLAENVHGSAYSAENVEWKP